MTEAITPDVVAQAARLARIALSNAEQKAMAQQLERVRTWAAALQTVDVADVAPMLHPDAGPMPLRPDCEAGQTLSQEEVLSNAPAQVAHHFLVPRVVG